MGEIYLIRHGQASFGAQNYDQLSETGISQSRRLGEWMREQGLTFDAVYSGERVRQQDTARLALEAATGTVPELGIEPVFNELDADRLLQHAIPRLILREPEIAVMLMNLQSQRDRFRRVFERVVDEWVGGEWEGAGIGNWTRFSEGVIGGLRTLAQRHHAGERIAVFTSGGPITVTLQLLGQRQARGLDWNIANTSITRVAFDEQATLELQEWRVIPHLADRPGLVTHL